MGVRGVVRTSRAPCPNVAGLLSLLPARARVPLRDPSPAWPRAFRPAEPRPPGQLVLRALGPSALQASWNGSEGAAWLRLVLRDLLGGANLTAAVRRGVSSHTFHHLSPGTPYELTLSAAAGPRRAAGPKAAEWTRECSACF